VYQPQIAAIGGVLNLIANGLKHVAGRRATARVEDLSVDKGESWWVDNLIKAIHYNGGPDENPKIR